MHNGWVTDGMHASDMPQLEHNQKQKQFLMEILSNLRHTPFNRVR